MKKLLLTAVLATVMATVATAKKPKAHELSAHYTFGRYVRDFGKRYTPAEYRMRESLFRAELTKVLAHNADKTHMWRMGVNQFSDWTVEEKRKTYTGARPKDGKVQPLKHKPGVHKTSALAPPFAVDWRQAVPPVLTAVKDQGQCGSCWAHSTTEALESAVQIATGERFTASQQQITSCAPNTNNGCDGNWVHLGFDYVVSSAAAVGGINQDVVVAYQSYNGLSPNCSSLPQSYYPVPQFTFQSFNQVPSNDATAFADGLARAGPLSIVVDASAWSPYESGIFNGCTYDANFGLDHAVQAVGYGTDAALGADYWIVRNSWNAGWGEDGYIRLLKESVGTTTCGWVVNATYNTQGQNTTVCGMCGLLVDGLYGVAGSATAGL